MDDPATRPAPRRLLRRTLDVRAAPDVVWERLARVTEWPSWALHIASARLEPPGPLGPASSGTFVLKPGIPTRFAMTDWEPPRRWRWRGGFLWLDVLYDHRFEPREGGGTRLVLEVEASGPGIATIGRVFAAVYARNLDRALPRLALVLDAP